MKLEQERDYGRAWVKASKYSSKVLFMSLTINSKRQLIIVGFASVAALLVPMRVLGSEVSSNVDSVQSCEEECNLAYKKCRDRVLEEYRQRLDECCILAGGHPVDHFCPDKTDHERYQICVDEAGERKEKRDERCYRKALKCLDECTGGSEHTD